jgi:hypothetical protein
MGDLRSYPTPRYQACHYPGLGCTFDAVTPDNKCHTLAGVGTARDWNICRCREYAIASGFTDERSARNETGQMEIHWYQPPAKIAV